LSFWTALFIVYHSEFFPVKYLQESEIKHGRVAMLAVVGFIVSEIVHLPGAG
jgi:Chlorophyll A-B binding protein